MQRTATPLCILALLLRHAAGLVLSEGLGQANSDPASLLPARSWHELDCAAVSAIPVSGVNLTAEEVELLEHLCWPSGDAHVTPAVAAAGRGVPPGVECKVKQWCDGNICTDVCERGSVVLEPWLRNAIQQQSRLVQALPLCFAAPLIGTHNSAITLADGYGNLDAHFQEFLKYIKWAVADRGHLTLRTNDQLFSLTDQLNMGVRAVELDTHWVEGTLRIAHCGGLHVSVLNTLVKAINLVAKLLHKEIRWDTETLGCSPSLSSIPVTDQRTLEDALREVKAWLDDTDHAEDFLLIYLDDQPDLATWGVVGHLIETILAVFPREAIFGMDDLAAAGGNWPRIMDLARSGRRLMFVSNTDYGEAMQPLVFSRGQAVCGWTEPGLSAVQGVPACVVGAEGEIEPSPLFQGTLVRVPTCELEYGPLNCDFVWHGTNAPVLDETVLPTLLGCGLNIPAPDLLSPARAAATVWTWAPGHPYEPEAADASCAAVSAEDGRWRAVPCRGTLPSSCRVQNATLSSTNTEAWAVVPGPMGGCPPGSIYDLPRHPRENYQLAAALRAAGQPAAWLPVHAPEWRVDGWPALDMSEQSSHSWHFVTVELPIFAGLCFAAMLGGMVALWRPAAAMSDL